MKNLKTALIIGGANKSGSILCKKFIDQGYYTFCIDDLSGDHSIHPKHWEESYYCFDSNKFIFIEEECKKFFEIEQNCQTKFNVIVMFIHNKKEQLLDWLKSLSYKPPHIVFFKHLTPLEDIVEIVNLNPEEQIESVI